MERVEVRGRLGHLRRGLSTGARALWESWHLNPLVTSLCAFLVLLESLLPSIQVLILAEVLKSVSTGLSNSALLWLLLLAVSAAGGRSLADIASQVGQINSRLIGASHQSRLTDALARRAAGARNGQEMTTVARGLRDSISSTAYVADSALTSIKAALVLVAMLVVLWPHSPLAGVLVVAAGIPPMVAYSFVSAIEERNWPIRAEHSKYGNYYQDLLIAESSGNELRVLGASTWLAERAKDRFMRIGKVFQTASIKTCLFVLASGCISAGLLFSALLCVAGVSHHSSALVAAATIAVISGMAATADAGYTFGFLMSSSESYVQLSKFLRPQRPAEREESHFDSCQLIPGTDFGTVAGMTVSARGLGVTYGSLEAVKDVSFSVEPGEIVAIVGANGAGKTSTVKAVLGLVDFSGELELDGLSAQVSPAAPFWLPQDSGRFELTVRENLTLGYGLDSPSESFLWSALDEVGLADVIRRQPHGLDTQLGSQWSGEDLSGGQWQRLGLARAILSRRRLWLLDEPTSAVDAEGEETILDGLRTMAAGATVIITTHRCTTLRKVDRILLLEDGRLHEQGTFEQLRALDGRFSELFASQISLLKPPSSAIFRSD